MQPPPPACSAPHPLAGVLGALRYPAWQTGEGEEPRAAPQFPAAFGATPFEFVDTLPALRAAAARLGAAREVAVDLEAHNYRSFQVRLFNVFL